jgi:isochorismate hydrolase
VADQQRHERGAERLRPCALNKGGHTEGAFLENSAVSKCHADQTVLVMLDLQQRLCDAMPTKVLNRVILNATLLARAAGLLEIPVLHTEQTTQELGGTHPSIAAALPNTTVGINKTTFSCCAAPGFIHALGLTTRRQAVLVGMEAHVCVLQSAFDLAARDVAVFVVEDAICSRRLENYQNALDRLRQAGVQVVSAESVVFEWLGSASHPHYKTIQSLLR